jgi:hypothetical protein
MLNKINIFENNKSDLINSHTGVVIHLENKIKELQILLSNNNNESEEKYRLLLNEKTFLSEELNNKKAEFNIIVCDLNNKLSLQSID